MKFLKKYFFLLLIVCVNFANDQLQAQIYPVQISAQLVPPYSGYLPDYADPTSEKLKVILQFNDFSQAQYNIKLRFEIKGNGFTISTKTFYNPPAITLLPGQPLLLSGADLAPYLNSNNLDFVGINQSQYQQRMALPEGYYSICIKAYDYYNTNPIQISNEACAQAWFTLSDPPYLNLPICNTAITPLTPQNILFQWTPVNMASPNSAFNTEYVFELFECRPDSNANPNQVVLSTAPIYSTTTQQTFFNYGIAEPPLNMYMKYIWRVRAKDITGRDLFKNNGYSQICTFTNGTIKNVFGNTLGLTLTARAINHRNGECTFTKQSVYSNYLLQVRKQNTNNWFNYPNTSGIERIPNLEPNSVYECRVRGEAGTLIGDWSNTEIFKTLGPPVYSCNDNTQPVNVATQPLPPSKAVVGLVIQSGQFEVITTQIQTTGQPGWYKGKGYALIFGALPVAVEWKNIYIDSEQRQQQGIIEAMTKGIDKWLNEWDVKEAENNATYVEGELDSVYVNGNQICYSLQGSATPICVPTPTGVNVVVIRDSEGNQWNIQLIPPPPKITGPTNYLNISDDQLDASDNLKVVFEGYGDQKFGFDKKEYAAFIDNYEVIKLANGKSYFVPNKSIGESATDEVIASYTLTGYTASQLSFKTKSGTSINATADGNKFKLNGIPANAECVYAWCDNKKIGKLNVISLKAISKKLVIVPVNNANTNLTASQLNNIYKQANVTWSITTTSNFTFNLGSDGLESADATLLSKYSSEMRALRDAYIKKDSAYDKQAYYLFVIPNFTDANLKGYMVRGRALGFIKAGATPKEIAHELAHGAFALEHTFPIAKRESTNNLLDYKDGYTLIKEQWMFMRENHYVTNWLDDEEVAALYGNPIKDYIKNLLGVTSDPCLDRAFERAIDAAIRGGSLFSLPIAGYTGIIEFGICYTEEDKVMSSSGPVKFANGFANELLVTIDVDAMASGLTDAAVQYIILKFNCLKNGINIQTLCKDCGNRNAIDEELKCFFGVSPQEIDLLVNEVNTYVKSNYDNPYHQGKAAAFILTSVIPVVGELKFANVAKVLTKLKSSTLYNKFTILGSKIQGKTASELIAYLKGVNSSTWLSKRTLFWDEWVNKCFPGRNWDNTVFKARGKDFSEFKASRPEIYDDMKLLNSNEIKLQECVESGSSFPSKFPIKSGDSFYKIVPKGQNISGQSMYYIDQAQLNTIKANPEVVEQILGLPLNSVNAEYDVFKITFKGTEGSVFKSPIASTEQYAKANPSFKYTTTGSGVQTLILDNGNATKWQKGTTPIESIKPNVLPKID